MSIKHEIREFLITNSFYEQTIPKDLEDDFPLLESGALDSIGIFNLIVFLEIQYKLKIEMEDLSKANFGSLNALEGFIRAKAG